MFGGRPPENVLAAIVIGDQRMLEAEPICDGANACPSNPLSANLAIAVLRIEARVSIERGCSALLRGLSWRPVRQPRFRHLAVD